MLVQTSSRTYEESVRITRAFLGPAAGRFLHRQALNHLDKDPQAMTPADLAQLIDWIKLAVSVLTNDREVVNNYIRQLEALADMKPTEKQQAK